MYYGIYATMRQIVQIKPLNSSYCPLFKAYCVDLLPVSPFLCLFVASSHRTQGLYPVDVAYVYVHRGEGEIVKPPGAFSNIIPQEHAIVKGVIVTRCNEMV